MSNYFINVFVFDYVLVCEQSKSGVDGPNVEYRQ